MQKLTKQHIDFIDDDPMDDDLFTEPMDDAIRNTHDASIMSFGSWIGTFIILLIPGIGLIFLAAWVFGCGNKNRVNFARALLLFIVIFSLLLMGAAFVMKDMIIEFLSRFTFLKEIAKSIL